MLAPNPADYYAEWVRRPSKTRKASTNLWVYERATGRKRYSITTEAGAKIQSYFDVPPPNDPNLYLFTVIGEVINAGLVKIWLTEATARELKRLLGNLDTEAISQEVLKVAAQLVQLDPVEQARPEIAIAITITREAYEALTQALPGVSDEHSFQLLAQFLRRAE